VNKHTISTHLITKAADSGCYPAITVVIVYIVRKPGRVEKIVLTERHRCVYGGSSGRTRSYDEGAHGSIHLSAFGLDVILQCIRVCPKECGTTIDYSSEDGLFFSWCS
jgi:hypothetical protein